jgi:hypothetical protein
VFRTVADPEEFQRAIPGGSNVEYLTASRSGVGTRFRSTRLMKGKPSTFELEMTEFRDDPTHRRDGAEVLSQDSLEVAGSGRPLD